MKINVRHLSLATKFNMLFALLIILTSAAIGAFVVYQELTSSDKALLKQGIENSSFLAKTSEFGVYTEDSQNLEALCQDLATHEDIAYVLISNVQHKVLAQRVFDKTIDKPITLSEADNIFYRDNIRIAEVERLNGKYLDIEVSILGTVMDDEESAFGMDLELDLEPEQDQHINDTYANSQTQQASAHLETIGYVRLGISKARMYERVKEFIIFTALASLLLIALGVLAVMLVSQHITAPLRRLLAATHAIADGKIGQQVEVTAHDETGELTVAFNSMSEQLKHFYDAIREHQDTLEQKVLQRTEELELARTEAVALAEKAQEASKAKSQFLATMSHEIRTPMNGVLGMTELLLETGLNSRQEQFARTVLSSGQSLLGIINDILDFSKIEAGKLELERTPFDLRILIEDTSEAFLAPAHERGIELSCMVTNDVPDMVRGDPVRLRQVITNLVGNALKFTKDGEVSISVSAVEVTKELACLRFAVRDSGIGISKSAQAKIFDSFAQADASTTRKFGGTGLGLAITQKLVCLMHGDIKVDSELGQGTTFSFIIKLQRQSNISLDEPMDEAMLKELKSTRLLIVDDNATNREIMHEYLNSWGIHHELAEDGKLALEKLRKAKEKGEAFDMALLDMKMPVMDGIELAQNIRDDSDLHKTRMLFCSSRAESMSEKESKDLGVSGHIFKPIRKSVLYDHIVDALEPVLRERQKALNANGVAGKKVRRRRRRKSSGKEKAIVVKIDAKILLVEDNFVNQQVAKGMLKVLGIEPDIAGNGQKALDFLDDSNYDLILMDCQMPIMDGFTAAANIRKREEDAADGQHIPVIALTANAIEGDRERCIEAGMDDYMSKPFSREQLQTMLQKWIKKNGEVTQE
ncbi:MAG: response regulator [Mariprofundales bacterium]